MSHVCQGYEPPFAASPFPMRSPKTPTNTPNASATTGGKTTTMTSPLALDIHAFASLRVGDDIDDGAEGDVDDVPSSSVASDASTTTTTTTTTTTRAEPPRAFAPKKFHSPTDSALSPASKFVARKAHHHQHQHHPRRPMGALDDNRDAADAVAMPRPASRFAP
jgi:hypothetical protein